MNNHLPSTELVIRPATFTDLPFIKQIAEATWPIAYEQLIGKEQVAYMLDRLYNLQALEEQLKNRHYFFLALQQFEPIGFASMSTIAPEVCKLQKLYVLPTVQKTGAGKMLLQTIETIAKSMGAKKLQLNVNRQNIARGFYEKNGFSIIRQEDIDIENGYFMNDYVMEKDL